LSILAVVVVVTMMLACGVAPVVFSQEKPVMDYKDLEGGKWHNAAFIVTLMRGDLIFDVTLSIDEVADGKITGVFTSKEKWDKTPQSFPFSSNIEKTPDGKLRFGIKIWAGNYYQYVLQEDGNFIMTSPKGISGVLKKVTE
jgi:hypothetical protein